MNCIVLFSGVKTFFNFRTNYLFICAFIQKCEKHLTGTQSMFSFAYSSQGFSQCEAVFLKIGSASVSPSQNNASKTIKKETNTNKTSNHFISFILKKVS